VDEALSSIVFQAVQVSKRFSERALSYPLEQDAPHRRIKFGTLREQIFKLKFSDKNDNSPTTHRATLNGAATTLDDIKRDMKSTIKTLSLLFLYLCMSEVKLFLTRLKSINQLACYYKIIAMNRVQKISLSFILSCQNLKLV